MSANPLYFLNAARIRAPIAVSMPSSLSQCCSAFVFAIMISASASFATPLGYQTNTMVYGVGGYRFSDYLRIGVPMNLMVLAISVTLAPIIWPF